MSAELNTILRLRVPVIVEIGRRSMPLSEVLSLAPGTIVELDKHADDRLTLRINNKPVGGGAAVKVGENFGIRLSDIASPTDRIKALAS